MKKLIAIATIAIAATLSLTGCGGTQEPATPEANGEHYRVFYAQTNDAETTLKCIGDNIGSKRFVILSCQHVDTLPEGEHGYHVRKEEVAKENFTLTCYHYNKSSKSGASWCEPAER